jgi:osmotically-inducible protein OsmY
MIGKYLRSLALLIILGGVVAGCQALTGQTLGEAVDDTTLTTTVKAQLAAEKASTLTRVGVDTYNGVVTLTGVVPSAGDRARAEEVTRRVKGVRGVNNNLQIQKN